jgi:glycosyltransferase involved in cell wall biosynthesis
MTEQQIVSCIIIFFNAGEVFFREAIQSILDQSYQEWELLLVDDGSTDKSTKVAKEYAAQLPGKVRYLEHEGHQNLGMSATRNLGLRHARGEYIAFLDADDVLLPNTLEEQITLLASHPDVAMVYGPLKMWYSWADNCEKNQHDYFLDLHIPTEVKIEPPDLFLRIIQRKTSMAGMLIRRTIVDKIGGFEDRFRGLFEDQVFCAKVCLQFPVYVSSQCWYWYRQHPDSCTSIADKSQKEIDSARLTFLNWLEGYLASFQKDYPIAWRALQRELWSYRYPAQHNLIMSTKPLLREIIPTSFYQWFKRQWHARVQINR